MMRLAVSTLALAALSSAALATAGLQSDTATLPADFRTSMSHYASVDRADGVTYRLYVNAVGLAGWQNEGQLPEGTVFAIEAFLAETGPDGAHARDAEGRLVAGQAVPDVHVAEKREAWADNGLPVTAGVRFGEDTGGDWRLAGYDPGTGLPTSGLDIQACHACHQDARAEDAMLSRGLLDRFARTGEPAFISFTCGERDICFGSAARE